MLEDKKEQSPNSSRSSSPEQQKKITGPKVHYSYGRLYEYISFMATNMFKTFDPSSIIESFPQIGKQSRFNREFISDFFKQMKIYAVKNTMAEVQIIMKELNIMQVLDQRDSINIRKEIFDQMSQADWIDDEDQEQQYLKQIKSILDKKLNVLKQTIDISEDDV